MNTASEMNTVSKSDSPGPNLSAALRAIPGLDLIEKKVHSKFNAEAPLLSEICSYLATLGGKRIRPALTLQTAYSLGLSRPTPELIDVAAGIELIHMATLLHDDIIDRSPLRRHQESPLLRYGSDQTLLCGDFLLVRAFSLCARLDQFIIDATEQACVELTEGEILEVPLNRAAHTVESSLTIARKKTASLFWLSCRSAAHLAGESAEVVEALSAFGLNLGLAFQILDDILDVISPEDLLGKKAGTDIRERKPSIVNVLWLASGAPRAARLCAEDPIGDDFVAEALSELRESDVVTAARNQALHYAGRAREDLGRALAGARRADHDQAALLELLIDYTVSRLA